MNKEEMIENLKLFVEVELESAELFTNTEHEVRNCQNIAFGAVRFAYNIGILTYEEMFDYWDDYILDRFNYIAQNAGKGPKVEII